MYSVCVGDLYIKRYEGKFVVYVTEVIILDHNG
jgi:hypothetical protein